MKTIINPHANKDVKDLMLLFIRIMAGVLLITHGYPKLEKLLSGDPVQFASIMGMSPALSLSLAMFAEFICASLIVLGLFTRVAAIPVIITMAVIVFSVHWDDPFSRKELPLLYLTSYSFLFFMGAGRYSLDYVMHRRLHRRAAYAM